MLLKKLKSFHKYNNFDHDQIEHYLNTSIKIIKLFGINTWDDDWKIHNLSCFFLLILSLVFISSIFAVFVVIFGEDSDMFDVL